MSVLLLAPQNVELYTVTGVDDGHGWTGQAPPTMTWAGRGNLQITTGNTARELNGGDRGPNEPRATMSGVLFLPLDVTPLVGWVARVDGTDWRVVSAQRVPDPTGGLLGCWHCQVEHAAEVTA
jgi:hypothetical protein